MASATEQPRPVGVRKLRGAADLWRIRVGDYRRMPAGSPDRRWRPGLAPTLPEALRPAGRLAAWGGRWVTEVGPAASIGNRGDGVRCSTDAARPLQCSGDAYFTVIRTGAASWSS
jgi:hypothetical protein